MCVNAWLNNHCSIYELHYFFIKNARVFILFIAYVYFMLMRCLKGELDFHFRHSMIFLIMKALVLWTYIVCFMVFNATFNNISVISWQSILFVEETGGPRENHWSVASHWQTLSHNWTVHSEWNKRFISHGDIPDIFPFGNLSISQISI